MMVSVARIALLNCAAEKYIARYLLQMGEGFH